MNTKVMNMLKGFRTIDKVFTMKADEAIRATMLCEVETATGTLVKGFTGAGVPFWAVNNWDDDDAMSRTNTIMGAGDGVGSRITAVPATGAVELEIYAIDGVIADYSVNDKVAPGATDGNIKVATTGEAIVGIVTGVTADGVTIYPMIGNTVAA